MPPPPDCPPWPAVAARDLLQREHTLLRNFPVLGHARYLLEAIGPELRQYLVAGNNEERPFTRDQRRWVYASAKKENNYFGFGTDNDLEYTAGYPVIKHRTFGRAVPPTHVARRARRRPARRPRCSARPAGRRRAFRPESVVNISAMSFGSLSGAAVEALNRGAALAGCLHNTGEGGLSRAPPARRRAGLPDRHGLLRLPRRAGPLRPAAAQGPGRRRAGPGARDQAQPGRQARPRRRAARARRCRAEIAATRGVPEGVDCISPSRHAEFSDTDSLLDWVELLAAETGPAGRHQVRRRRPGVLGRAHRPDGARAAAASTS